MCGRYVSPDQAAMERSWRLARTGGGPFATHFNVAPTTVVPMMRREGAQLVLDAARWGLVPTWWKDRALPRMSFNARAEEAAEKPLWRHALRHARCLMPALGWYEWQSAERTDPVTGEIRTFKQPYFLHRADGEPFAFAGLWSPRHDGSDAPYSCALLTRDAPAPLDAVHDRMPVVLPREAQGAWLDPELTDIGTIGALLRTRALADFAFYPVRTAVNNTRNDGPQLIEPLPPAAPAPATGLFGAR